MLYYFTLFSKNTKRLKADPNVGDKDGNTALHKIMGIFSENREKAELIITYLLNKGANPNQKNNNGYSPLYIATY